MTTLCMRKLIPFASILCFCLCLTTTTSAQWNGQRNRTEDKCGELFLTVSAFKNEFLEVNWNFTCRDPPERIRLFSDDPEKPGSKVLLALKVLTNSGYYLSSIKFEHKIPEQWERDFKGIQNPKPGPQCLNYWVASFREGQLIKKTCLKIQPTWMETYGDKIEDIPMGRLFIPGTHNSGCYDNGVNLVSMVKYVFTQKEDVWNQLIFGIRYLDFRIGYYNTSSNRNEFWINHDVFKVNRLVPVLRDIKAFLSRSKKEIVILDLHRFPVGFKSKERERHKQLVDLLQEEIGDIAIPRVYQKLNGPTLRELWKQNRRLIVSYNKMSVAASTSWLWDPLTQYWGDIQTTANLVKYLNSIPQPGRQNSNPFWAAMAELTPNTALVLFGILSSSISLASLADQVNRNITHLYRYSLANKANIVASDYFLGNDLIDVAIQTNLRKTP